MSVAASRWAWDYLAAQPAPRKGGLSLHARPVLLALALHARYPANGIGAHIATVSAATIGRGLGRGEHTVRRALTELADRSVLPVIRRPGRAAEWHFVIAPMSTTPVVRDRGPISTTPVRIDATPVARDRRRDEGGVLTSTDAVPRGGRHPVRVFVDTDIPAGDTWDDGYYAPVLNDGRPWEVR